MKRHCFFENRIMILEKKFRSDLFKCSNCGRTIYIKVLGDKCTCSECGGTMYRQ